MVTNTAGSQHRDVMLVVQGESLGPEVVGSGWGPGQDGGTDLEHLCLKKLHKQYIFTVGKLEIGQVKKQTLP